MTLLSGSALISGSRLFEKILSFVIIIIASRYFGSEGIGEFFYYFSLVSLFIPLMDMGFEKLLIQRWWDRSISARKQLLGELLFIKLCVGCLALIGAAGTDYIVRWGNANPKAVLASFLAIYLTEIGELVRRPAHAEDVIRYDIVVPVFARLLTLGGLLCFIGKLSHGYQIIYLYAIANGIGMMISFLGIRGYWPSGFKQITKQSVISLVKAGIPFSMTHFFVMLSLYVDSVMLGKFSTMVEVGSYNAAYRVILVVVTLSGGACHVLFPKISKLHSEGKSKEVWHLFSTTLHLFLMIFGAFAVGGIIIGPLLMVALYGEKFQASGLPFQLLSILIPLAVITNLAGHTLEALGKQKLVMKVNLRSSAFNFIANLAIIPWLGMVGAAITTILTETISLIYQLRAIRAQQGFKFNGKGLKRVFVFVLLIFCAFIPLKGIAKNLAEFFHAEQFCVWFAVGIGGIIFAVVFLPFKHYWISGLNHSDNVQVSDSE